MCYFHTKFNVKKKLKEFRVAEELKAIVNNDITGLHCALSEEEFNNNLFLIKNKWSTYQGLDQFTHYFFK